MALEDYVYNPLSGTPLDKKVKVKKEADPLSSFAQDQLNQVIPTVSSIVNPVQEIAKKANIELPQSNVIQVESPVLQSQGIPGIDFPSNNLMSMGVPGVDFDLTDDDEIQQIKSLPFENILGDLEIYKTTPTYKDIIPTIQDESKLQPSLAPLQTTVAGAGSVAGISQPDLATPFSVQKDIDNINKTDTQPTARDVQKQILSGLKEVNDFTSDAIGAGLYEGGKLLNKTASNFEYDFSDNELLRFDKHIDDVMNGLLKGAISSLGSVAQSAGRIADKSGTDTIIDEYQNKSSKSYETIIENNKKNIELADKKLELDGLELLKKYGVQNIDSLSEPGKQEYKSLVNSYQKKIDDNMYNVGEELGRFAMTEEGQNTASIVKDYINIGGTIFSFAAGGAIGGKAINGLLKGSLNTASKILGLGLAGSSNIPLQLAEWFYPQGNSYDAVNTNKFDKNLNTNDQVSLITAISNFESVDAETQNFFLNKINTINKNNGYTGKEVNRDNIWDYAGDAFKSSEREYANAQTLALQYQSEGGLNRLFRQNEEKKFSNDNKSISQIEGKIKDISGGDQSNQISDLQYHKSNRETNNKFRIFLSDKEINISNIIKYVSDSDRGAVDTARLIQQTGKEVLGIEGLSDADKNTITKIATNKVNETLSEIDAIKNRAIKKASTELVGLSGEEWEEGFKKIYDNEKANSSKLKEINNALGGSSTINSLNQIAQNYGDVGFIVNPVSYGIDKLEGKVGSAVFGSEVEFRTNQGYWASAIRQSEVLLSGLAEYIVGALLGKAVGKGKVKGELGSEIKNNIDNLSAKNIIKNAGFEGLEEGVQNLSSTTLLGDSTTPLTTSTILGDTLVSMGMGSLMSANNSLQQYLYRQGIKEPNADSAKLSNENLTPDQINELLKTKEQKIQGSYTSVQKENVGGTNIGKKQKVDLQTYIGQALDNPDSYTITINSKLANDNNTNYSFLKGEYSFYKEGNNTVIVNQGNPDIKYNMNKNEKGNYVIQTIAQNEQDPIYTKEIALDDITTNKLDQGIAVSEIRKKGFDVISKFKSNPSIQNTEFDSYEQTGSEKSGRRGLIIKLNDEQKGLLGYDTIEGILEPNLKGYKPEGSLTLRYEDRQQVDSGIENIKAEIGQSVAIYDKAQKIGYIMITDYNINEGKDFNTTNKKSVEYVKKTFNEKMKNWHGGNAKNYFVEEDSQQVIENGKWVKGYYDYTNKKIVLRKDADYTTIIHEVAHAYLDMFVANDKSGINKFEQIKQWYNAGKEESKKYIKGFKEFQYESNSGNLGEDTKELHEAFARHFEWYTFVVAKKELGDKYPQTILGSLVQEMTNFFKLIASYWARISKFKEQPLTTGVKNIYNDILIISDNKHPDREAIEKAVEMAQEEPGHDALKNNAIAMKNMIGNIFGGEKNVYDVLLLTYFNNLAVAGKLKSLDKAVISDNHKRINLGKLIIKSLGYKPIYIANRIQDRLKLGPEWKDTIAQYTDHFAIDEDIIHNSRERLAKYMIDNNINPMLFNDLYTIVSEIKEDLALTDFVKEDLGQISAVSQVINEAVGVTTEPGTKEYVTRYIGNKDEASGHYEKLLEMEQNISEYDKKSQLAIINDLRVYQAYLLINDQAIDTNLKYGLLSMFDYKQYLEFLDGFTYTQRIYMNSVLYRYMKDNDGKDDRVSFKEYLKSIYDKPGSNSYLSGIYDDLKLKKFSNRKQLLIDRFSDFIQGDEGFNVLKDFFLQKTNPFIDAKNKSLETLLLKEQIKYGKNKSNSLKNSIMNFYKSLDTGDENPTYEKLYYTTKSVLSSGGMDEFKNTMNMFIKVYETNEAIWKEEIELYDDIQGTTNQENMLGYLLSNFLVERLPENTGYVGNKNVLKWAYNYNAIDHNSYMNMEIKVGNKTKKKSDYTFSIPLGEAPTTQYKNSNTITFKKHGDKELSQEGQGKLAYTIPGITITKDEGGTMYVNIDINDEGAFDIPKNNVNIFNAGMEAYFSFLEQNYSVNSYGNVKNRVLTNAIKHNAKFTKGDNQLFDNFFSVSSEFNKKTKDIIAKYISKTKDYIVSLNVSGLIKSASGVFSSKSGIVSFHDGSSEDVISVDNMKTETFWKQAGHILYTYGFIDQQFSDVQTKAIIGSINGVSKSKSSRLNGLLKNMTSGNNEYELGLKAIEVLKYIKADSIVTINTDKDSINLIDDGYTILNVINKLQNVEGSDAVLFKSFYNQIAGILGLIKDKNTFSQLNYYLHGYFPDELFKINENNKNQIANLKIKIEDFKSQIDVLNNRIISKRNKNKNEKESIKSMKSEITNLEKEIKDLQYTINNINNNKEDDQNKEWTKFIQGYKDNFENIKNIAGILNSIGSSINTDVLDKIITGYTDIRSDLNIRSIDDTDTTRNALYTKMSLGKKLGFEMNDDLEFLNAVLGKNNILDSINDPTSFSTFTKSNEPGDKVLNLILNSIVFNNEFAQYKGYNQSGYKNAIRVGYSYLFGHGVNTINGSVSFTDKEYNKDIIEDVDNFINEAKELYKTNKIAARSLIGIIGFKGAGSGEKSTIDFTSLKNAIINLIAKRQEDAINSIVDGKNYNLIKFFGSLVKNFKNNNYVSNPTELSNASKLANDYIKNNINEIDGSIELNEAQERAIGKFNKIINGMLDAKFGKDKKTKVKGKTQKDGKTYVVKPNTNIDSQFLVIHGPANTGKTTLIKSIIDNLPGGGKVSYFVGAKNNVTKNVLEKELKVKATTVFDMLYSGTLKNKQVKVYTNKTKKEEIDTGNYEDEQSKIDYEKIKGKYSDFTKKTTYQDWDGKISGKKLSDSEINVLIIDEAQGVDQDELELFKKLYKKNAIIVMLGDPMQPIVGKKNEYFDRLIKTEDKNSDLKETNFSILDKINFNIEKDNLDIFLTNFFMRQTNFGKDVGTLKKVPIVAGSEYSIENQDAIQFIPLNSVEEQQNISADIIAKATDKSVLDPTDAYLLTYKNETRVLMNDLVRSKKFGDNIPDVREGDIMMYLNSDKDGSKFSVKKRFIVDSKPVKMSDEEVREDKSLSKFLDKLGISEAKVYLYNGKPHIFVKSETLNYGGLNNTDFPIISYGYALTSDGALGTRAGTVVVYNDFNEGLGGQDTIEKERIYTAITRARLDGKLYIADADWYVKYGIKGKKNELAIEDSIVTEFSVKENNIHLPMYVRGSIVDKMVQGFGHIIDGIDDLKNEKINLQKMFQTFIQEFSNTIPYNQSSGDQEVEDIHTTFKSFFAPESNIPNILSYDGITTTQVNDIINRYNKIVVDKYNDIKKASIYNNRQDQGEFSSDYLDIYDTDSKELKGSRIYQNVGQDNDKYFLTKIENITPVQLDIFAKRTERIDENLDLLLSPEDYVAIQYEGKDKSNVLEKKINQYIKYLNRVLQDNRKKFKDTEEEQTRKLKENTEASKNLNSIVIMFKGQDNIDFNNLYRFSWDEDGIKNKIEFMNNLLVNAKTLEQQPKKAIVKDNKDNYFVKLIDKFKDNNLDDILLAEIYDILYSKGEVEGDKIFRNELYSSLNDILFNQYIIEGKNYSDIVVNAFGRLFGAEKRVPNVLQKNKNKKVKSYSFKTNNSESSDSIFEYQNLGGLVDTVIKKIFDKGYDQKITYTSRAEKRNIRLALKKNKEDITSTLNMKKINSLDVIRQSKINAQITVQKLEESNCNALS